MLNIFYSKIFIKIITWKYEKQKSETNLLHYQLLILIELMTFVIMRQVSVALGFDYEIRKENNNFDLSLAQVINEKENKKIADKTSLNEKLSDLIGSAKYEVNKNIKINYDFSIDQNYKDFNYNEISTSVNFKALNINFDILRKINI